MSIFDTAPSFIFGGENTAIRTPEDLARKRALVDAMMTQQINSQTPRNLGEGLGAIGKALMVRQSRQGLQSDIANVQAGQDAFRPLVQAQLDRMNSLPPSSQTGVPQDPTAPVPPPSSPRPFDGLGSNMTGAQIAPPPPTNPNMPAALSTGQPAPAQLASLQSVPSDPSVNPPPVTPPVPVGAASGQLAGLMSLVNKPEFAFLQQSSPAMAKVVLDQIQNLQAQNNPLAQIQVASGNLALSTAQAQRDAVLKITAGMPPDQQAMALANPDEFIKNQYLIQMGQRNIGYVNNLVGGNGSPQPAAGGSQTNQPASSSTAQPYQDNPPQDTNGGPNINMDSIPIPTSVANEARLAAMGKDGVAGSAAVISKYRADKAAQLRQDYYQAPAYLTQKGVAEGMAKRTLDQPATTVQAQSKLQTLSLMEKSVQDLLDNPGLDRISGITGLFPNIPGSNAANATAGLDTLKTKTAFSVLQAMREGSPTGGALGQISDKEETMLQNSITSLDTKQSPAQLRKNLQDILAFAQRHKANVSSEYKATYGKDVPQNQAPDTSIKAPPPPPIQGARQAPDGKWYVPDSNRPGKYLQVNP